MAKTLALEDDLQLKLVPRLLFLHMLSSLTFFLTHGTSVAMAFKVRSETSFERIRAMLDLSGSTIKVLFRSFLAMGITGLILPLIIKIWNEGWVWLSIVLMLMVLFHMLFMNDKRYKHLRKLMGLPYMKGKDEYPAEPPASQEEVEAHLKKLRVEELVVVGYMIPMIVLWLMVFKPF